MFNIVHGGDRHDVALPPHDGVGASFQRHRPAFFARRSVKRHDVEAAGNDGQVLVERQRTDAVVGLGRPDVFAGFVPVREAPVPATRKHALVLVEVDHGHGLLQLPDHPRRAVQVHDRMRSPLHHKWVAPAPHVHCGSQRYISTEQKTKAPINGKR